MARYKSAYEELNLYVHGKTTREAMKQNKDQWHSGKRAALREEVKERFDEEDRLYMNAAYRLASEAQEFLCYDVQGMTMKYKDCVEQDNWKHCIAAEVSNGNIDKWFKAHVLDGIVAAAEHDDMTSKDYNGTFESCVVRIGPAEDLNTIEDVEGRPRGFGTVRRGA